MLKSKSFPRTHRIHSAAFISVSIAVSQVCNTTNTGLVLPSVCLFDLCSVTMASQFCHSALVMNAELTVGRKAELTVGVNRIEPATFSCPTNVVTTLLSSQIILTLVLLTSNNQKATNPSDVVRIVGIAHDRTLRCCFTTNNTGNMVEAFKD